MRAGEPGEPRGEGGRGVPSLRPQFRARPDPLSPRSPAPQDPSRRPECSPMAAPQLPAASRELSPIPGGPSAGTAGEFPPGCGTCGRGGEAELGEFGAGLCAAEHPSASPDLSCAPRVIPAPPARLCAPRRGHGRDLSRALCRSPARGV